MEVIAEKDDVDGFEFLSFEDIPMLECYLEELYAERKRNYVKPFPPGYRHFQMKTASNVATVKTTKTKPALKQRKKKATKTTSSSSSTSKKPNTASGTGSGGSRVKHLQAFTISVNIDSAMEQQDKRIKKTDKRYVEDKLGGFLFVSGISLKDLDDHDEHMGPTWSMLTANKRKGSMDGVTPGMIKVPRNIYDDMVTNYPELGGANQMSTTSDQPLKKYGLEQLKKLKRKLSRPGVTSYDQISDNDYGSLSGESENLDVCGIDDATSRQFIEDRINKQGSCDMEGEEGQKNRCSMCCYYPCKIIEAKRVSTIQGGIFPKYNVSFISTCNVHPAGDIAIIPRLKLNVVDTCIQTTISDIKMHAKFAQQFSHETIAVNALKARPEQIAKQLKPGRKSEHHRSSEQKRREQMHDSFIELRKVIYTSQALKDNTRASKQWILIEATKVINSLKNESTLLTAMRSNLRAKNKKLIEEWEKLAGKEFDPDLYDSVQPGQTKLINLYKEYRKDVHHKSLRKKVGMSASERLAEFCKKRLKQEEVLGKKIKQEKIEPIVVSDNNKHDKNSISERQDTVEANESRPTVDSIAEKTATGMDLSPTIPSRSPKQNKTSPLKNLKTIFSKIQKEKLSKNVENKTDEIKFQEDKNDVKSESISSLWTKSKASSDTIDPAQNFKETDKLSSDGSRSTTTDNIPSTSYYQYSNQPGSCVVSSQRLPCQTNRLVKSNNVVWPPVETPQTNLDEKFTSCSLGPVSRNHQPFTNIVQSNNSIPNQPSLPQLPTSKPMAGANMRQMQDEFMNKSFPSNKPFSMVGTKPTQWTTVGRFLPTREVTVRLSMPDIAAFVELGEDPNKHDKIVLLDASENKNVSSPEVLNKFESITSNDIYNKRPISSTTDLMLPGKDKNQMVSEILVSKETNNGLCVISNVFSLSEGGKECMDLEGTSVKLDKNTIGSFLHDHDYSKIS